MVQRLYLMVFLLIATLLGSGCAASLFKVKPFAELPPLSSSARSVDAGGVSIRVGTLLSDEESQELFEANLPLSGILAVRMEMQYVTGVPIEMKRARFRLRDAQGREWKLLSPKKAVSRILKANEVFAYNPSSRKEFEREFGAYALEVKTPISDAEQRRHGFLFFQSPDKRPVGSLQKMTLTVERLPQAATIELN